ncbi:MAG: hypothetical protein M1834_000712 [Cirrosporium novae-zelandiae]|nr:MAG: hypothetical protein M1834_000712 [Cirrosporium novae-zelandiae]
MSATTTLAASVTASETGAASATETFHESNSSKHSTASGSLVISSTIAGLIAMLLVLAIAIGCLLRKRDRRAISHRNVNRMKLLNEAIPAQTLEKWKANNTKRMQEQIPEFLTQQLVCVICLDPILPNQQIRALRCNHVFHKHCIDDWYLRQQVDCPLCKVKFMKEDTASVQFYPHAGADIV